MDIGIKLDIGFSENASYCRLFGTRDPLSFLWDLGVRAVETAIDTGTDFEALGQYVHACAAAGFRVSLHPYTERAPGNPGRFSRDGGRCRQFHTKVFSAAEEAAEHQGRPAIVNVHGGAGSREDDRDVLLIESIRFFTWARKWCSENAPHVNVITELQFRPYPDETIQRIGDGYAELLDLVTRAEIDACWDLGHAYMNAQRFDLPIEPPAELLPRIVHIHCHDVTDIDHHPLVYGRVPWGRLLGSVLEHGFDKTVILEVPPENYLHAGGLDALTQSIDKLAACAGERLRR
jgi:sugar phosphate isomerase/epimerase